MTLKELKQRIPKEVNEIEVNLVWMRQDIKLQPENADYIKADYNTEISRILWDLYLEKILTEAEHERLWEHYEKKIYR